MQDLAALVRVDGVVGEGDGAATAALRGASIAGGETAETHHVVAARGMALALTALQGLLQHLALLEDSSNKGTFSLTIGEVLFSVNQRGGNILPLGAGHPCQLYFTWVLSTISQLLSRR